MSGSNTGHGSLLGLGTLFTIGGVNVDTLWGIIVLLIAVALSLVLLGRRVRRVRRSRGGQS